MARKKTFKYKPDNQTAKNETAIVQIVSFPGYLLIGLGWLLCIVGWLYFITSKFASEADSIDQATNTNVLVVSPATAILLGCLSLIVWWFFARANRKVVMWVHKVADMGMDLYTFAGTMNVLGWALFFPFVIIMWPLSSDLAAVVCGFAITVGTLSLLLAGKIVERT